MLRSPTRSTNERLVQNSVGGIPGWTLEQRHGYAFAKAVGVDLVGVQKRV